MEKQANYDRGQIELTHSIQFHYILPFDSVDKLATRSKHQICNESQY